MTETTLADPFRPFVVDVDDGTRLVLSCGRSRADWTLRVCLYLLVLLIVGLEVLIVYAVCTRYDDITDLLNGVSFGVVLYILLRVVLFAFHIEGPRRIVAVRGELALDYRGAVRKHCEPVFGPVAIVARTTETVSEQGDVRWLALEVRTHARTLALGSLYLDPHAEPTREAAARAAAATLAARLGVPLELDVPATPRGEPGG
ncbi:hypothetical protein SAMN02745121_08150 [Nannocystis exedens]|uniref:Uncharacterized protein n=1 Tax=Nannocystis exedens TaxID=54 RepID=A0A1I2HPK2_9BACT|nr:hypothetical protein [Nannocystis exedens]PCC69394.1 hypothetical protein NAEX_02416 [Nannocystis exedens]SFF32285.1 hypothetical protein SAMN02745121_08150 [Nannocystis exedens]